MSTIQTARSTVRTTHNTAILWEVEDLSILMDPTIITDTQMLNTSLLDIIL